MTFPTKTQTHARGIDYHLGLSPADTGHARECIFQVHYGSTDFVDAKAQPARLGIAMQTEACGVDLVENWYGACDDSRSFGSILEGQLHSIEQGDEILIFGTLGRLENPEHSSFHAYSAILKTLHQKGFHRLVRSWNFIPQITHRPGGGLEIYQSFCKGRALAFEACGFDALQLPAATGIGCYSADITGYLVASKRADYLHVENPLQSPAYRYPAKYGPKSPSFARGTLHRIPVSGGEGAGGATRFFLSGTASIREAETMWPGDIRRQVTTTMENIRFLISAENPQLAEQGLSFDLADFDHFKVYFRHAADYDCIRRMLTEDWHIAADKLHFMNVDVCRSDLLVELEGCINLPDPQ